MVFRAGVTVHNFTLLIRDSFFGLVRDLIRREGMMIVHPVYPKTPVLGHAKIRNLGKPQRPTAEPFFVRGSVHATLPLSSRLADSPLFEAEWEAQRAGVSRRKYLCILWLCSRKPSSEHRQEGHVSDRLREGKVAVNDAENLPFTATFSPRLGGGDGILIDFHVCMTILTPCHSMP